MELKRKDQEKDRIIKSLIDQINIINRDRDKESYIHVNYEDVIKCETE